MCDFIHFYSKQQQRENTVAPEGRDTGDSADKAGLPGPDLCSEVYGSPGSFTISLHLYRHHPALCFQHLINRFL